TDQPSAYPTPAAAAAAAASQTDSTTPQIAQPSKAMYTYSPRKNPSITNAPKKHAHHCYPITPS
ncbi:hypothetical protein COCCADRAFT_106195, partial [Bipolaris zeicola 26-R-13]